MTRLSEKRDVQDALVNYLIGIGWEYLPPDEVQGVLKGQGVVNPETAAWTTYRILAEHPGWPYNPVPDRGEPDA
jgi:hypothetical protein